MAFTLSERQQATVAAALTIVAAAVILAAAALLLWALGAFVSRFSSVFLPLAAAGVLAMVVHPYYAWLRDTLRFPVSLAVVAVLVSMLLPLVAFGWFFGALIVDQASGLVAALPEYWASTVSWAQERMPRAQAFIEKHRVVERVREAVAGKEPAVVQAIQAFAEKAMSAGAGVLRGVGVVFAWAVMPVYFVFFLVADPRRLRDVDHLLPFLKEETRRDVVYLVREFVNILVAFFRGQLLIALLQGLLYAIGFSAAGLRYGFVLGLMLGLLNIIPFLGSIVGLGIALPLALFQPGGGLVTLALVLAVFTVVQLIESYVLTPKIMGDRTGLHPMMIIIAIFFWGSALGGISGMLLAIPLTAFLVVFWRLARDRYIGELV